MSENFQYGDLIFLGLIAVFVILRLRSMLGRGTPPDLRDVWKHAARETLQEKPFFTPERAAKKPLADEDVIATSTQENVAVTLGLKAIRMADINFSTVDFLSGAKLAFEWVVDAFSKNDKDKLRMLLSEERFKHFSDEIDTRSKEDLRHETTLVSVLTTDITEAQLQGSKAQITVQFTSEQVSVTRDAENKVVGGDPSELEKVIDVWTFERDVSSRDPNWKIVAT